ncbi:LOW QUALITY PROTEIN: hypothetical protein BC936DRAFT_139124 [Jimgerdemannia flammicorona]|uniref:DNA2/NAM7 helicase helicase domain-containing protein n=1 Tax=Jimgerdemannia flammicorona TaxID=994334 RepID=A0A433BAM3_9FUNG|nr:LOW QUALITY PROTEIN: hypothetical protein BC936DRAFT_139124 [Jimgerdemannia flammicorona]
MPPSHSSLEWSQWNDSITCNGSRAHNLLDCQHCRDISTIIVDKAAQLVEAESLIILKQLCERLCLIGDTCQLSATVQSRRVEHTDTDYRCSSGFSTTDGHRVYWTNNTGCSWKSLLGQPGSFMKANSKTQRIPSVMNTANFGTPTTFANHCCFSSVQMAKKSVTTSTVSQIRWRLLSACS